MDKALETQPVTVTPGFYTSDDLDRIVAPRGGGHPPVSSLRPPPRALEQIVSASMRKREQAAWQELVEALGRDGR